MKPINYYVQVTETTEQELGQMSVDELLALLRWLSDAIIYKSHNP